MKISNLVDAVKLADKYTQTAERIAVLKFSAAPIDVKATLKSNDPRIADGDEVLILPLSKTDLIACLQTVQEETEKALRQYGIYPDPQADPTPKQN